MTSLQVFNPYGQKLLQEIPMEDWSTINKKIDKACQLFSERSNWIAPFKRKEILQKVAIIMKARLDLLAKLAASEGGKPYKDSKVEVLRAINGVELAAEEISRLNGTQIPMGITASSVGRLAYTMREPIGVVASISAFNHPLNLIVHQTITAFAAGCPVLVKPAGTTPLSCLQFMDILSEAGMPDDWVQSVICNNENAEKLATDPRINYLSFIGSAKVGWYLKSKLSPGTRCALEHGGAAPVIVDKSADLEELVPAVCKGAFYHAGQVCVSVQRLYVHETLLDELLMRLEQEVATLQVGDPLSEDTDIGPLILPKEQERIAEWVDEAVQMGATVICGGEKLDAFCYAPTILLSPSEEAKVSKEEIFGPVLCVYPFSDKQEAYQKANQLPYHFQAAIYSQDLDAALEGVLQLNATAVMVNDHTAFRVDWMPFGGRDHSGEGLGGIPYSMHEMTREKLMVIKSKVLV